MVDWALAARVGKRVASPGPDLAVHEARAAVAELQVLADAAVEPVAAVTRLQAARQDNTVVVDRPRWIDANIAGMESVVGPALAQLGSRTEGSPAMATAGAKLSAVQLGAALGWISGKVLGQYEAFTAPGQEPRLLLIAPNIVEAERAMEVPARDFRLWVCLHEEAHRVQFGAVPWLSEYFHAEVNTFLAASDIATGDALRRMAAILQAVAKVVVGNPDASVVEAAQTPAQLEVFARLSALMSLLEGHAEWVMDAVGPELIPSLGQLRKSFDDRRNDHAAAESLLRRLMGLDAKLRQYTHGRAFVSGVVDRVGVEAFNRVWDSPANLPTMEEIAEPQAWVDRVLGNGG